MIWQRPKEDHRTRRNEEARSKKKREGHRVAKLVDQGMLSRGAGHLCSQGLAPRTADTALKLGEVLFTTVGVCDSLRSTFLGIARDGSQMNYADSKSLAPSCSGLRAEHLKAMMCDQSWAG